MSILQKIYDGKYSTGHVLTKMPFTLRLKQRAFFDAVEEAMGAEFVQRHRGSLEEAARTCGASHMESLTDVTLPLIRPAMVSGFFLIFLPAMREVTTSILLYGPYTRTLGVQIYSLRDAGMIPQAAALGSVAIIIIIICNTIVTQATKDRKGV